VCFCALLLRSPSQTNPKPKPLPQVPLPLLVDLSAGSCAWELALPDPRAAVPTLASKIRFVAAALAKAAFGTCEDEQVWLCCLCNVYVSFLRKA
jgi:hypothetical protein